MATLIDTAEWTDNEVYEIQQTDAVEGAAAGASFSGIGVSNHPHQQLANRTKFLKGRQDTNTANIGALQAFQGLFKGLMARNGYVEVPFQDVSRGQIVAIVQWGYYAPPGGIIGDTAYTVTWPLAFPNVCEGALAMLGYYSGTTPDVGIGLRTDNSANPLLTRLNGTFYANNFNVGGPLPGFFWLAIGF